MRPVPQVLLEPDPVGLEHDSGTSVAPARGNRARPLVADRPADRRLLAA
jgi:hypothetical protein